MSLAIIIPTGLGFENKEDAIFIIAVVGED